MLASLGSWRVKSKRARDTLTVYLMFFFFFSDLSEWIWNDADRK